MKILTLSKRLREIYPFDKEKIIKDRVLLKKVIISTYISFRYLKGQRTVIIRQTTA